MIVLTGSPAAEWMQFTVNQALQESNRRDSGFILPIKLKECTVPEELATLTVRECEEGQIKQEHWDELVQKCRQP